MSNDDIAFKCNFAVLDEETGLVTKRRVDRAFHEWGIPLCDYLNNMTIPGFENYKVACQYATEHRCGVKITGEGLTALIEGTDPLKDNLPLRVAKPIDKNDANAIMTANIVNALSKEITRKLNEHEINKKRKEEGK